MRALAFALSALCLSLPSQVCANFVFGCAADSGKMPRMVLRVLDTDLRELGRYDSAIDLEWRLSGIIQLPMADSLLYVEYIGDDRRPDYGDLEQRLTVEFADLLPPDKADKHPAGRANNIPVGEMRPVVNWLGSATYLTVSGVLTDNVTTPPCQWFCQIDIDWRAVPVFSESFGRVKALYDSRP